MLHKKFGNWKFCSRNCSWKANLTWKFSKCETWFYCIRLRDSLGWLVLWSSLKIVWRKISFGKHIFLFILWGVAEIVKVWSFWICESSYHDIKNEHHCAEASKMDYSSISDEEWKKKLTNEQFYITRQKGTERAFTGYDLFHSSLLLCWRESFVFCLSVAFNNTRMLSQGTISICILVSSLILHRCIADWSNVRHL